MTSFALLLSGNGGNDPCASTNVESTIAWISLAFILAAIVAIIVAVVLFEIRLQIRRRRRSLVVSLAGDGRRLDAGNY